MKIAITGGTGFIGLRLVKVLLSQGHEVRLLSRQNNFLEGVKHFKADLCDPSDQTKLEEFLEGVDVLFHCAGEIQNIDLMKSLHVSGTQRLVKAATGKVARWVQLSSVGAYGYCREGFVTEKSPEVPLGTYETTKTQSDEIVRNSGIPFVILRPSNVFGPTMTNQSLFQLVEMIRRGLFFLIGNKRAIANYVHVDDVVNALVKCGFHSNATGNVFNLSQTISIEQMSKALLRGLGLKPTLHRLPELPFRFIAFTLGWIPGFPLTSSRIDAMTSRCRYDSTKIVEELEYTFESSLEERFFDFSRSLK